MNIKIDRQIFENIRTKKILLYYMKTTKFNFQVLYIKLKKKIIKLYKINFINNIETIEF